MGCFSVSASVSGTTIKSGDRVVFWILKPHRYYGSESDDSIKIGATSSIVSNEGSRASLAPAYLPIFGEYNDYGSLENIDPSSTTLELEEKYGKPIDEIIDDITRGDCEDHYFGMFEHESVYKSGVEWATKNLVSLYDRQLEIGVFTKHLGFFLTDKTVHDVCDDPESWAVKNAGREYEKYSVYTSNNCEGLYVFGSHSVERPIIVVYDKKVIDRTYTYKYLVDELKERNIEHSIDFEILKTMSAFRPSIDKFIETIQSIKDLDSKVSLSTLSVLKHIYTEYLEFLFNKEKDIIHKDRFSSYIDMRCFESFMFSANRMYFPAMHGEQHGNLECSEALLQFTSDVLSEQRSYYEE